MTAPPTDVVLDVDTGVDDALALLLAARAPGLRLRAVSCVEGNVPVDRAVANTRTVLHEAGARVPVARGCDRPLVGPPTGGRRRHGQDGMADLGLPEPPGPPAEGDAVELLRTTLAAAATPMTVLALAPLTNLATLLRRHPGIGGAIARLVVVGGAPPGRAPDFNLAHDPQAAAIVLGSGVPVSTYGAELFPLVTVPRPDVERLAGGQDPAGRLAGQLLRHQRGRWPGAEGARIGDAGAVAAVLAPHAVRLRRHPRRVVLAGADRGALRDDPAGPPLDAIAVDRPEELAATFLAVVG